MIYAVVALFLMIGLGGILAGRKSILRRRQLLSWPEVPGRILRREVQKATRPGGGPPAFRKEALIVFQEEGNDREFTNLFPGSPISDDATIEKWMGSFPERVPLRKNPSNPDEVVLLHGTGRLNYLILAVGILSVVIGLLVLTASFA